MCRSVVDLGGGRGGGRGRGAAANKECGKGGATRADKRARLEGVRRCPNFPHSNYPARPRGFPFTDVSPRNMSAHCQCSGQRGQSLPTSVSCPSRRAEHGRWFCHLRQTIAPSPVRASLDRVGPLSVTLYGHNPSQGVCKVTRHGQCYCESIFLSFSEVIRRVLKSVCTISMMYIFLEKAYPVRAPGLLNQNFAFICGPMIRYTVALQVSRLERVLSSRRKARRVLYTLTYSTP